MLRISRLTTCRLTHRLRDDDVAEPIGLPLRVEPGGEGGPDRVAAVLVHCRRDAIETRGLEYGPGPAGTGPAAARAAQPRPRCGGEALDRLPAGRRERCVQLEAVTDPVVVRVPLQGPRVRRVADAAGRAGQRPFVRSGALPVRSRPERAVDGHAA